MSTSYCIKPGYQSRPAPEYFNDTHTAVDAAIVWQPEVYEVAKRAARKLGVRNIIDIGCGSAAKLTALHPEFDIIGVDFGSNLEFCRKHYGFGRWLEADFETCDTLPLSDAELKSSVIVCSDVIEHLVDPLPLLRLIRSLLQKAPLALISTPERNLKSGLQDCGPPFNPHHVREWALGELTHFAIDQGFTPVYSGLTTTNSKSPARNTILLAVAMPTGSATTHSDWRGVFPPEVNSLQYRLRVWRKSFGEWRRSLAGKNGASASAE